MSSPASAVVFQPRYLSWLIGIILVVLAVLGLLGVIPFDPKLFWGAMLVVGIALFL
jgi:hypothetical protein